MMSTRHRKYTQKNLENYVISGWEDERFKFIIQVYLRGIYAFGFEKPSPIQCQTH